MLAPNAPERRASAEWLSSGESQRRQTRQNAPTAALRRALPISTVYGGDVLLTLHVMVNAGHDARMYSTSHHTHALTLTELYPEHMRLSTSTQLYTPASSCIRRIALDTYAPLAGSMATKHTHAIYRPRRRPAQLSSG